MTGQFDAKAGLKTTLGLWQNRVNAARRSSSALKSDSGNAWLRFVLATISQGQEHIKGQPTWDTAVEVFALVGHPKARCAYAWMMYREGKEDRTVVVLGLPPVASAQDAVKVAMASKAKR